MNTEIHNTNNKKIIGSIIKFNRIKNNISQKKLCNGICVPSYLSRIENGELLPSEDVLSIIFNRLGLTFNDSESFIAEGHNKLNNFFENLNYNEFDYTNSIFDELEDLEQSYITSPLIIDYYLAKLARYCTTPIRDKFESSQVMLLSSFDLLSPKQKSLYNFYVGLDMLLLSSDKIKGKELLEKSQHYRETGHGYFWLSYAYRLENNPIKAYDCIKKALDLYVADGNLISIMSSYEKFAEVYFLLDNYTDAIKYLDISLHMAKKINNIYFIEHINSILAWSYYRLGDYSKSLDYLKSNTGLIDHRLIIPDSVTECLIYFSLNDFNSLKESITKLENDNTLLHINKSLSTLFSKLFHFYIDNPNYIKSEEWEMLLLEINSNILKLVELKKVIKSLLKDYYISNRRYKDALFL